jgi:TM2 domain-containing membrane protein YozV
MIFLLFIFNTTLEPGAVFLMISPGATQVGMGMGGVAYPNDIPGIYYNPANINLIKPGFYIQNTPIAFYWNLLFTRILNASYDYTTPYIEKNIPYSPDWLPGLYPDMKYMYGGIKFPSYKNFNFGINYTFLSTGETEASINDNYYNWYTYDYAIGATIGTSFFDEILSMGITLKYIYSFLAPEEVMDELEEEFYDDAIDLKGRASLFTYDVGLLLKDPTGFSSFGVSYSNISGTISYGEDNAPKDPLPRFLRIGYSISPVALVNYLFKEYGSFPDDLTRFFEVRYHEELLTDKVGTEHDFWHSTGWEFKFFNSIYFREGKFYDRVGGRRGNTKGFGLRIGNIKVDYADDSNIYAFWTENYRVSLSVDLMEGDSKYFAFPLSFMFPGAGHLYLGNAKKGLLYGGAGTLISMLYPFEDERKVDLYSTLFYLISIISTVDLAWSL